MIIKGDVISTKTISFEEIEKLPPVDRVIDIEDLPEINLEKNGGSNERRSS